MIKTPVKWRPYGENEVELLEHSDGVYFESADYDEAVRRINAHEALVAALEKIRDYNCEHDLGDLQQFIKATVAEAIALANPAA